ncbi:uncharacterized protein [Antedon mediterranea]|uniref:uncharacterized protein n=1 Tax=Antedon mediterranea TaxID=105859 RepID=UPI003AF604F4
MGVCDSCLFGANDDGEQPDVEAQRRQQAEAAEKRAKEAEGRGLKDPEGVKRKRQKMEEAEKKAAEVEASGQQAEGLKWQVSS